MLSFFEHAADVAHREHDKVEKIQRTNGVAALIEVQGWLDPVVAKAMRELVLKTKPEVIVEIGVFYGKSLINFATALKENGKGIVYGIDSWRTRDAIRGLSPNDNPQLWTHLDLHEVHTSCVETIWEHELEEHAVIIRSASENCWKLFEAQSVDMLYIDGGHSEEASVVDAALYLPAVRPRGYVWVDDASWPSLQSALTLVRDKCELFEDFGHCHLYQKL
jgi:predicted O-methyltransferase YrrM